MVATGSGPARRHSGPLARLGPDRTGLSGDHPAAGPARDDEFRLRWDAERPVHRALHSGFEGARVQGRLYPFLLGTASGFPWRGRITYSNDVSSAATSAVDAFLGSATTSDFTRDNVNLTVGYSGYLFDWTYRRMILHYANLCVVAGGVNLFVIGSELRGLETIRGPGWTPAGTTDGSGNAIWDYPFVAGLIALSDDVRSVFDGAGLTKNLSGLENLVTYSADWSNWMGWQHPGENGQWPHLDQLWAHANIDFVSFDNYLSLTDWTTGGGGLDVINWSAPAPSGSWPPSTDTMSGLGLSGMPTIYSMPTSRRISRAGSISIGTTTTGERAITRGGASIRTARRSW